MNGKKWITIFMFIVFIIFIMLDINYRLFKHNRHYVDYLVNEYIPNLENRKYETIILGDSLAKNAFSALRIHEEILDLTSNQAISMAGNYFLLKRYATNNRLPNKIYLFGTPEFLQNDLDQKWTYLYFITVFNQRKEIEEIKKFKPNLFNKIFSLDKYFESRKNAITFSSSYITKNKIDAININEIELYKIDGFMNKAIENRIKKANNNIDKIKNIPKIYLDKIIKFCRSNNIKFTLIIEPMPKQINAIFQNSAWNKYLNNQDINLININDFYDFNSYFFNKDGMHIRGKVNHYYQNLIDKHILDIY